MWSLILLFTKNSDTKIVIVKQSNGNKTPALAYHNSYSP